MKVLALVAASAAVIGLAACSSHSSDPNAPAGQRSGTAIAPVSCGEQYRSWTGGAGKHLMGALSDVTSAARAGNDHALKRALKHAKPAVAKAARHPIPACADPMGYWSVLLMHVNAAAAGTGTASSVRAALQEVPKIHSKLLAEVKQVA
jgi:hypothetical protein